VGAKGILRKKIEIMAHLREDGSRGIQRVLRIREMGILDYSKDPALFCKCYGSL
jgi:hypothetical protein